MREYMVANHIEDKHKEDHQGFNNADQQVKAGDFWRREWPLAWEGLDRDDDMEMAEPKHDEHEASLSATRLRQATACLRRCLGFAVNTNACIESEGRFYHYAHALDGALTEAGAKTLSSCDRKKRPARRP